MSYIPLTVTDGSLISAPSKDASLSPIALIPSNGIPPAMTAMTSTLNGSSMNNSYSQLMRDVTSSLNPVETSTAVSSTGVQHITTATPIVNQSSSLSTEMRVGTEISLASVLNHYQMNAPQPISVVQLERITPKTGQPYLTSKVHQLGQPRLTSMGVVVFPVVHTRPQRSLLELHLHPGNVMDSSFLSTSEGHHEAILAPTPTTTSQTNTIDKEMATLIPQQITTSPWTTRAALQTITTPIAEGNPCTNETNHRVDGPGTALHPQPVHSGKSGVQTSNVLGNAEMTLVKAPTCMACRMNFSTIKKLLAHLTTAHSQQSTTKSTKIASAKPMYEREGKPIGESQVDLCTHPRRERYVQSTPVSTSDDTKSDPAGEPSDKSHLPIGVTIKAEPDNQDPVDIADFPTDIEIPLASEVNEVKFNQVPADTNDDATKLSGDVERGNVIKPSSAQISKSLKKIRRAPSKNHYKRSLSSRRSSPLKYQTTKPVNAKLSRPKSFVASADMSDECLIGPQSPPANDTVRETPVATETCEDNLTKEVDINTNIEDVSGLPPSLTTAKLKKVHQCSFCNVRCKNKRLLQAHYRQIHIKSTVEPALQYCKPCDKTFQSPLRYRIHERKVHTGRKPYKCDVCGKDFRISSSLKAHQVSHTKACLFNCTICGVGHRTNSELLAHQQVHDKGNPYQCTKCPKGFSTERGWKYHLAKHVKEASYKRSVCDKVSVDDKGFPTHQSQHHEADGNPSGNPKCRRVCEKVCFYQCGMCNKKMFTIKSWLRHLDQHPKGTSCKDDKILGDDKSLADHQLQPSGLDQDTECHLVHENVYSYQCSVCSRKLYTKQGWSRHVERHCQGNSSKCSVGGHTSQDKKSFISHQSNHDHVDPKQCKICRKVFSTINMRRQHIMEYHSGRTFECLICDKELKNKIDFLMHRRKCQVKYTTCVACDHAFSSELDQQEHERSCLSAKRKIYCCTIYCDQTFVSEKEWRNHMRKCLPTSDERYHCKICDERFEWGSFQRIHPVVCDRKRPNQCLDCGRGYANEEDLYSHINSRHMQPNLEQRSSNARSSSVSERFASPFKETLAVSADTNTVAKSLMRNDKVGEDVGVRMDSSSMIDAHTHTEEAPAALPWPCPICQTQFETEKYVQRHVRGKHACRTQLIRYDSKTRNVYCKLCDVSFWNHASFRLHEKNVHLSNGSFACPTCEETFQFKSLLEAHRCRSMQTNTEHQASVIIELKYRCVICDKKFQWSNHLKTHRLICNRMKHHQCSDCGRGYSTKYELRIHIATEHKLLHSGRSSSDVRLLRTSNTVTSTEAVAPSSEQTVTVSDTLTGSVISLGCLPDDTPINELMAGSLVNVEDESVEEDGNMEVEKSDSSVFPTDMEIQLEPAGDVVSIKQEPIDNGYEPMDIVIELDDIRSNPADTCQNPVNTCLDGIPISAADVRRDDTSQTPRLMKYLNYMKTIEGRELRVKLADICIQPADLTADDDAQLLPPIWYCEICYSKLSSMENLAKHYFVSHHTGSRETTVLTTSRKALYQCSICANTFSSSQEIQKHMKTHSGETITESAGTVTGGRTLYQCAICSRQFNSSEDIKCHMKTHSADKRHECPVCKKRFFFPASLEKHQREKHALSLVEQLLQ